MWISATCTEKVLVCSVTAVDLWQDCRKKKPDMIHFKNRSDVFCFGHVRPNSSSVRLRRVRKRRRPHGSFNTGSHAASQIPLLLLQFISTVASIYGTAARHMLLDRLVGCTWVYSHRVCLNDAASNFSILLCLLSSTGFCFGVFTVSAHSEHFNTHDVQLMSLKPQTVCELQTLCTVGGSLITFSNLKKK